MASCTWKVIVSNKPLAQSHINKSDDNDAWIWSASNNGNFGFKSAWNVSRDPLPSFDLAEVVWCQFICPKMSCCLLRALSNRILPRARLLQFGRIEQDDCVLCNSGPETSEKLFFSSEFSS